MSKLCFRCKNPKNNEFAKNKTRKDGLSAECKSCVRAYSRSYVERKRKRESDYRRKYGISIDIYESMLKSQNGCCMICSQPESQEKKLDVDHCHQTGKVRALLCAGCNRAIGLLKDDRNLALNLVNYLDRFKESDGQS